MTCKETYIKRFSAWAPGQGIPELAFTDPLFRRRLSQISKMTIQVVYGLLPLSLDTKIIFLSFRGELLKQFKINKMQIEDGTITPAAFSFSVFNAPVALASIALGLKGGYSAIYPGENSFYAGLKAAHAALHTGIEEELVFVYADEEVPPEYTSLLPNCPPPFAFALLLNRNSGTVPLSFPNEAEEACKTQTPLDFLNSLLLCGENHVQP
jgi:hypothetical protein